MCTSIVNIDIKPNSDWTSNVFTSTCLETSLFIRYRGMKIHFCISPRNIITGQIIDSNSEIIIPGCSRIGFNKCFVYSENESYKSSMVFFVEDFIRGIDEYLNPHPDTSSDDDDDAIYF